MALPMIDNFALALTHGLMLLAAWRLLSRPDLDDDSAPPAAGGPGRRWSGLWSRDRA
jgi:hypothetical protein